MAGQWPGDLVLTWVDLDHLVSCSSPIRLVAAVPWPWPTCQSSEARRVLRHLVWVADRGFASAANRAYLTRGGQYIHAENLRHTNTDAAAALACPGRYHTVAGNLRVKEVWVPARGDGSAPSGS